MKYRQTVVSQKVWQCCYANSVRYAIVSVSGQHGSLLRDKGMRHVEPTRALLQMRRTGQGEARARRP